MQLKLHFQFRAQQLNEPWTGESEQLEDVFEALGRIEIGALFVEDMNNPFRVQIVEVDQELIRVHNSDIERVRCLRRKVARIKGDNRLASSANCSGKNMPVFLVVGHRRSQVRVALHPGISKILPQLRNQMLDLRRSLL